MSKRQREESDYSQKVSKIRETAYDYAFKIVKEPPPNNVMKKVGDYFNGKGNKQSFLAVAQD